MSRYVGAAEAARLLGVQRPTLYAYVSRGLIARRTAVDGRTSLYAVDDLERLAARGRQPRRAAPAPSLDVQIVSGITVLGDGPPRYRRHDAAELARTASVEQVAELLWTGVLGEHRDWPPPAPADVAAAQAAIAASCPGDAERAVAVATLTLAARRPDEPAAAFGRLLLSLLPEVVALPHGAATTDRSDDGGAERREHGRSDDRVAARLAAAWAPAAGPPLASVLKRALIVLADHELTTSTMAVRLAASVRAGIGDALAAGLAVLRGPLHGSASAAVHRLLERCAHDGVAATVRATLDDTARLPGFGHTIYAGRDPRLAAFEEALGMLPDPTGRLAIVDQLLAVASERMTTAPNVDLGLGALTFVAELPPTLPIFSVARIPGLIAHYLEELDEPALRYRAIARPRP